MTAAHLRLALKAACLCLICGLLIALCGGCDRRVDVRSACMIVKLSGVISKYIVSLNYNSRSYFAEGVRVGLEEKLGNKFLI